MKAILMSIKPKWCEKIFSGKMTIKVCKTAIKLETPFKVYVYCTKERMTRVPSMNAYLHKNEPRACAEYGIIETWGEIGDVIVNPHLASKFVSYGMHGKVVGEFVCDEIYEFITWGTGVACIDSNLTQVPQERVIKETCLTEQQIMDYLERGIGNYEGVGLHISDLKIYDTPRALCEFIAPCKKHKTKPDESCKGCPYIFKGMTSGKLTCDRAIMRAPQSWMYVEEI